ncbi:MAG: lipid-A-disaccharide synthase N-terminal domain-containing protein [Bacteroidota bacterium]|nr:lipid-A-disaccharide synthase N-terminal domain-containing protein [Bacteroidota bacterium]
MKEADLWVFAVGFLAQLFFFARMIIQWFKSEVAGKSLSPLIFWQLSLLGSIIFLIYGILRKDLAIIFGQCLVYYIYVRNLHLKQRWTLIPGIIRWIILFAPLVAFGYLFFTSPGNLMEALTNKDIPLWLKLWGILGQFIFTLRFFMQWIDSEAIKQSILSQRFWVTSLIGSAMIIIYAVFRYDPVLFLGQLGGLVVYVRNLMIYQKNYQK